MKLNLFRLLLLTIAFAPACSGCTAESTSDPTPAEVQDPIASNALDSDLLEFGEATSIADQPAKPKEPEKTLEALVETLAHDDPSTVVAAADTLVAMGPEAETAVPELVGLLGHSSAWIRVSAMDALAAMKLDSVPELIRAFEHEERAVGVRAGLVLRTIGHEAIEPIEKTLPTVPESSQQRLLAVVEQIRADAESGGPQDRAAAEDLLARADAEPAAEPNASAQVGDWAQFHGPARDNICQETGLLHQWPEGGPKLLWKLEGLGKGYSTVAFADGKLWTMGDRKSADADNESGTLQFVMAYDLATRRELWATPVGPPHDDGPRCTPTVDGALLYVIGTDGDLVCVESATGKIRWQKHLVNDFGGKMMSKWKFSESPLVDGDRLVCTPGAKDATLVALDKTTGKLLWKSAVPDLGENGADGAAYSSMVVADIAGTRQYVQLLGRGVVGVEAETGRFLWGYNRVVNRIANITTPVVYGDHVFATTSYRTGSVLLKILADGDEFAAQEVYFLGPKEFENHHGGVVLADGHLYGGHAQNKGQPVCFELATGKIRWNPKALSGGSAAVLYADGQLIFRYDRGLVALVEATPDEFRLRGSFTPPTDSGPAWAHPVIHDGKLYLRHNNLLLCYDVRAGE